MTGFCVGDNNMSLDDLDVILKRTAESNKTICVYTHRIMDNPSKGSVSPVYLERVLRMARAHGIAMVGFDEVDP